MVPSVLPLLSAYTHQPTSQKRRSAVSSCWHPREAERIYRCPCPVPNQRRPLNAAKCPAYLAASTRTGALCRRTCLVPTLRRLPKAAKHPAWPVVPARGCAYLSLPLLSSYPLVPPKCGEAPYLMAAPTQSGALCHRPRMVPNQRRPPIRRSTLSTWRCTHDVASSFAEPA